MIEIEKAKKAFQEYIKQYNPEDEKVKLKINHILRVTSIARKLAEDLKLDKEDIELAELIGLLHDIGRFEQIKRYHTFYDKDSINHGKFGVQILFEEGLIRKFVEDNQYDEIIRIAILNHNCAKIEEGLTDRQKLHCQMIRDADKLDIFYVLTVDEMSAIYDRADFSDEKISDKIYQEFKEDKVIYYPDMQNNADSVVSHFAYVYDFNFSNSLRYIFEKAYIDQFYKRFSFKDEQTQERLDEIYHLVKKYVQDRIQK